MHKKIISNQLGTLHRWLTFVSLGMLLLSGLAWLYLHYFVTVATDFGVAPHPSQAWWLKLHGLAAMAALIIFGSLMPGHIRRAWQHKKNRGSGGTMVATMVALSLTGYALYYIGGEEWRPIISVVHWIWGAAMLPLIALHIVLGRRARTLVKNSNP